MCTTMVETQTTDAKSLDHSMQHVLTRMFEHWKTILDNNYSVGAILMDLLKAFDYIPHDLLVIKLHDIIL